MDNVFDLTRHDRNPGTYWKIMENEANWSEYHLYIEGNRRMGILSHAAGHLILDMKSGRYIDAQLPSLASAATIAEKLAGLEID